MFYCCFCLFVFLKVFGGHMSFFGATGTPALDFWVFALFAFCAGECNVHSPGSTSGATNADLLAAGAQPVTSHHACAEVGFGFLAHLIDFNQMCYCCRKLENLNIFIEMYRSASNVQLSDWLRERILYI